MASTSFLSRLLRPTIPKRTFSTSSSSSILSPNSTTPLTSQQKSLKCLSLLKRESNPSQIVSLCNAASLTPSTHLDRQAFSLAVRKLSNSNQFTFITQLTNHLLTTQPNQLSLSHSLILLGQAGLIEKAIETFQHSDTQFGIPKTVKSLNALLFAGILAKQYKEVKRVYLDFPRIYNIEPNLETYNLVIKSFSESALSESGYSVLAEMERKGVKPNAASFSTLISGFYREGKVEEVEKVLEMMKGKYGMEPKLGVYNVRIKELCKMKRSAEAKGLFEELVGRRVKVNNATYGSLIYGFCKEGDLEEAKRLFKRMVNNSGCKPTSHVYFTLIYYLCKGGDFDSALRFCKESMEKKWVPTFSIMKLLVNGLVSVSKVDEARELIGQVKEKFSDNADKWSEIEAGLPQ